MTDHNIPGVDDITGKPILGSREIWPEDRWQPPAAKGLGIFQTGPRKQREARIPANPDGSKPDIVSFPDNWPGITLTEVGAVFDYDKVTRETWVKFGRFVGAMNMRSKLWVADWIRFGSRDDWGFTYNDMKGITGLEVETLRSYASIGWAVPVENRILGPKPSFYAAVAPLPHRMQRAALERAKKEGLSRDDLRLLAKPYKEAAKLAGLSKNKGGRPAAPVPSTLADDMEAVANLVPAQPLPPEYEGGMQGANAFLDALPATTRVRIVVLAIED